MTTDELLGRMKESESRIAVFRKAAFHVHSPDSHDWAGRPNADKTRNSGEHFSGTNGPQLYGAELSPHFDIVAITDHMKCDLATRLASENTNKNFLPIPGMEISCEMPPCPGTIHLLVLLPPGTTSADFDRLFSEVARFPTESARKGEEKFKLANWTSFRQKISDAGGLLIFAHIGADAGHRQVLREAMIGALTSFEINKDNTKEIQAEVSELYANQLADLKPDAVEILKAEEKKHFLRFEYDQGRQSAGFPCVVRSDFHCIEEFSNVDARTYLKLATLDFESVKKAFHFPLTRIRFHADLPSLPSPRFLGISIEPAEKNPRLSDMAFAFSPNLNCLIGPRGSGKTTIIEAIRLATGNNLDFHQWTESVAKEVAKSIQKGNLQDAIVRLLFRDSSGRVFRLEASFSTDGKDVNYRLFDERDALIDISERALKEKFKCRIFSWSQLESLGRNHNDQRELIDAFTLSVTECKEKLGECLSKLLQNDSLLDTVAIDLESMFSQNNGELGRYREYKTDFEALNTDEMAELFEGVDRSNDRLELLDEMITAEAEFVQNLKTFSVVPPVTQESVKEEELSEELQEWLEPLLGELPDSSAEQVALQDAINKYVAVLELRVEAMTGHRQGCQNDLEEANQKIRDELKLDTEQEISSRQRSDAKDKFETVKASRDRYLKRWTDFESLFDARVTLVEELSASIASLRSMRMAATESINSEMAQTLPADLSIGVSVADGVERTTFVDTLESEILSRDNAGQFRQTSIALRLARMGDGRAFGRYLLQADSADMSMFEERADEEGCLKTSELTRLHDDLRVVAVDNGAEVSTVDGKRLKVALKLQQLVSHDRVSITLNGKPIESVSPGQRCSALLPLVALAEDCPLIIDQPEDNLDNRLVGGVMTNVLSSLKERRQIIMSTHNANLVVGGDAEQVVVFEPSGERCVVASDGSIDSDQTIAAVLAIMEGGKEAFDARKRRYGS